MEISNLQRKKLEQYVDLLLKWNSKINLIGKSTINDLWDRHIIDCAQLIKFLNEKEKKECNCADFGSGAGLPGIVLSILGVKNMTLIEKSPLKCKFLKEASLISENKIKIINENIFNIKNCKFDIIFSRALANLNDLLVMSKPFLNKNSKCYFLKGKKIMDELINARKNFDFEYSLFDSLTSNEGKIVILNFR